MKIFKPGTTVRMGSVVATVVGVLIRPDNYIQYQVVWWEGAYRRHDWVEAVEIQLHVDTEYLFNNAPIIVHHVKTERNETDNVTLKGDFPSGTFPIKKP